MSHLNLEDVRTLDNSVHAIITITLILFYPIRMSSFDEQKPFVRITI